MRGGRFWAIAWHDEEACSFRRKLATGFFHCKRSSSEKLRRAVALIGEQQRHSGHPAFLADGTSCDIDPADPEQLLLPSLLLGVSFCYRFIAYNLPA
jgi:hypothetical protein